MPALAQPGYPSPDGRWLAFTAVDTVNRVLFGEKDGWACFVEGLLTQEEIVNLVAAHVCTRLEKIAEPPEYGPEWDGFIEALARAMILGDRA